MGKAINGAEQENPRIVLGLLESVGRDGAQSQRRLAAELGIALGLVNAYLKRCVGKGLVKVRHAPTNRYAYYLTPKGFAEKSRLTISYLTSSLSFFRHAKADCVALFEAARDDGHTRVLLVGQSDFAEIAVICAIECGLQIVGLVDPDATSERFLGVPVVASFDEVDENSFDAAVVTDIDDLQSSWDLAKAHIDNDRILIPPLLRSAAAEQKKARK